ncbi:MAG TPA: lysylphosphatidylglycerol synthase domain-containing protein [Gaiellaceae bacterium]|nr:lysylphosphatidylglycerol synthase domain-containing protein [Gaiellaceae bacterium]
MSSALSTLGDFSDRVAALDARWMLVALAFHLGNLSFRTLAWRGILRAAYPDANIRLLDVGPAYAAGVAANAYLPARGGEAVKIALVRLRVPGSTLAGVGASSGVVLLFDAAVGVSLLGLAWALGLVPALPQPSPFAVAAGAAVLLAGAALVASVPRLRANLRQGVAILATPRVYLRRVVPYQAGAWVCRLGVAFAMLAAFGVAATIPIAGLVVVAGGMSTLVPATPGGAGTQQLFTVVALAQVASAASALSFSIGLQVGVTLVNTLVGLLALTLVFGTLRPAAIRAGLRGRGG